MPGSTAVIDIGSNSILLLLARRDAERGLIIERDIATVARLSEGASQTGRLSSAAIARALEVLRAYASIVVEAGAVNVIAVATEGVRMVDNAADFLGPASEVLGVEIRTLSGEDEARLSYRSVALEQAEPGPLRVVDIGGASTELVVGNGLEVEDVRSHALGSVRYTERFVSTDPPTAESIALIDHEARRQLATQPVEPSAELHGLAGTVTTAAALLLGLDSYDRDRVDGQRFSREGVVDLRDRLAGMTVAQRLELACLGNGRADVIVAGTTILGAVMDHCGASTLVVRDRGLRYALL